MTISDILSFLDENEIEYEYIGCNNLTVNGFSSLQNYASNTITWMKNPEALNESNKKKDYTLVVAPCKVDGCDTIITNQSKYVFFSIIEKFFSKEVKLPNIGANTYISRNVKIGKNVKIGHNCSIDGDIEIGDNTIIYNNVSLINSVRIGNDCIIQSGVSIGHDGFGFTENEKHEKHMIKHYGGVCIGSDVYIGGNTYIERGTLDNTIIQDGCKIDGCCVVGHNTIVKKNAALVTGTFLFGSVKIGEGAYVASAIVRNQISIGSNALVGMGSVVTKDIPDNIVVAGNPAKKFK